MTPDQVIETNVGNEENPEKDHNVISTILWSQMHYQLQYNHKNNNIVKGTVVKLGRW